MLSPGCMLSCAREYFYILNKHAKILICKPLMELSDHFQESLELVISLGIL